jgi:hypothetical protein
MTGHSGSSSVTSTWGPPTGTPTFVPPPVTEDRVRACSAAAAWHASLVLYNRAAVCSTICACARTRFGNRKHIRLILWRVLHSHGVRRSQSLATTRCHPACAVAGHQSQCRYPPAALPPQVPKLSAPPPPVLQVPRPPNARAPAAPIPSPPPSIPLPINPPLQVSPLLWALSLAGPPAASIS